VGGIAFAAARAFVAESLLVPDEAVRTAQHWLWQNLRLILEPGGATAFAAVLSGAYRPAEGERVAVLLCGGNADPAEIAAP
jgi:threonine dehydratase